MFHVPGYRENVVLRTLFWIRHNYVLVTVMMRLCFISQEKGIILSSLVQSGFGMILLPTQNKIFLECFQDGYRLYLADIPGYWNILKILTINQTYHQTSGRSTRISLRLREGYINNLRMSWGCPGDIPLGLRDIPGMRAWVDIRIPVGYSEDV